MRGGGCIVKLINLSLSFESNRGGKNITCYSLRPKDVLAQHLLHDRSLFYDKETVSSYSTGNQERGDEKDGTD
jgi:hypothetical protein